MADVSRRSMIKTAGSIGLTILPIGLAPRVASAQTTGMSMLPRMTGMPSQSDVSPEQLASTYLFLNHDEASFVEAACARLIPADEHWPGALEAGAPNYIDKQLGGAWGAGERLYRSGPWGQGTPSQGYQLPFTPAELFRAALTAIIKELNEKHLTFANMNPNEQDAYLQGLEAGGRDLGGVPSDVFFAHLWECTLEGFFSDPVYGGNRNMVSWRMIGFPGAYASYYDLVDQHGIKIDRAPMSLGEDAYGRMHMDPGIHARMP
jgi:gluconate 2-dehydrogenase gamma chain